MEIPFVGGAYAGRSSNIDAQVCQNLFVELDKKGGKPLSLIGTPGLEEYKQPLASSEVRGMIEIRGVLYVVAGASVFMILADGTVGSSIGTLQTSVGLVFMEYNESYLMIVDGYRGYTYTWSASPPVWAEITDGDFSNPGTLTYQDGYFIVSASVAALTIGAGETITIGTGVTTTIYDFCEINSTGTLAIDDTGQLVINNRATSGLFYVSDLNDPTSWDASQYATAEGSPDNLLRAISIHRDLWLLGSRSAEVWYNSGETVPFTRTPGVFLEVGCGAKMSAVKADNTLFWLTDMRRFVRIEGFVPKIVSTPSIEYAWRQYTTFDDANAFSWITEGHEFIQITFPTENKTWVYDVVTNEWHTRTSKSGGVYTGRHKANCFVERAGDLYVGDYSNGKIYKMLSTVYDDDDDEIQRIRAAQAVHKDRKLIFHDELEIEFEAGVGLASGASADTDPQASLDWSDDGGHTFKTAVDADIGASGEYSVRARWRRLGRSRDRVYRVTMIAKTKIVMIGAHLRASVGNN